MQSYETIKAREDSRAPVDLGPVEANFSVNSVGYSARVGGLPLVTYVAPELPDLAPLTRHHGTLRRAKAGEVWFRLPEDWNVDVAVGIVNALLPYRALIINYGGYPLLHSNAFGYYTEIETGRWYTLKPHVHTPDRYYLEGTR